MMNKQKATEKIEKLEGLTVKDKDFNLDIEMIPKGDVLEIIEQIDEPEKPVLTKEEAEWIEKLRELNPCTDEMIATISHRHADCDFVFKMNNTKYKLHFNQYKGKESYGMVRNRLLRAVLYGYEVKKAKLYTVKFSNEDFGKIYIGIFKKFNKLGISSLPLNDDELKSWFTEDELKRFKFWDNPAFEVREVEG